MSIIEKMTKEYECSICKDDGKCLNSPSNPNYKYDEDDMLDYILCWSYIRFNQPKEYEKHLETKRKKEELRAALI